MSFFWVKTKGLKADIERHRAKEQELISDISRLESDSNPDPMTVAALRVYRRFLAQCLQSKADVLSKLGRK